jgi:hypothetical protein
MAFTLASPYLRDGFRWMRGNLHAHTTASDGRLTLPEIAAEYARRGYDFLGIADHDVVLDPAAAAIIAAPVLVPCVEVTAKGPHMLAIGVTKPIPPCTDRQQVIDEISAQRGLSVMNHPNWGTDEPHIPQELLYRLRGYHGIEIYNGIIDFLEGESLATDRWDRLLSHGIRAWGYANDDTHQAPEIGRAWNVVQAVEPTVPAIFDALRAGRFYASTGVEIERVEIDRAAFFVRAPNAQRIVFRGAWGRVLMIVDACDAVYVADGSDGGYVRAECLGAGGQAAWTQPAWVSSGG